MINADSTVCTSKTPRKRTVSIPTTSADEGDGSEGSSARPPTHLPKDNEEDRRLRWQKSTSVSMQRAGIEAGLGCTHAKEGAHGGRWGVELTSEKQARTQSSRVWPSSNSNTLSALIRLGPPRIDKSLNQELFTLTTL